jgi:hypothetical protein
MKVGNQGKQTHHPVVHNLLRGAGAIAGFLAGGPGAASAGFKIGDKVGGLIDHDDPARLARGNLNYFQAPGVADGPQEPAWMQTLLNMFGKVLA